MKGASCSRAFFANQARPQAVRDGRPHRWFPRDGAVVLSGPEPDTEMR
jgi:hypothetical protein